MTFGCRGPDIPAATGEGDPHILSDGEKQTYCVGYKQWSLAKRAASHHVLKNLCLRQGALHQAPRLHAGVG